MSIITVPFSWLLLKLYDLTGNYGLAVILFALVVKIILLPFQMKSKRSVMRTTRLAPRLKELEKRHEGNKAKYQEEVAKLYREEKINPMSGCIWSLIPFPILIALYSVIRQPLTKMMRLSSEAVTLIQDKLVSLGVYTIPEKVNAYSEIDITELIHKNFEAIRAIVPEVIDIDYGFLGMNLGMKPQWNFFLKVDWSNVSEWLPALGLFLIPLVSAALSFVSMKVSSSGQDQQAQDAAAANTKTMMYMMPLISVYICFIMPAALGIYWIASSVFSIIQDIILNKHYTKVLDKEDAERRAERAAKEAELELKRQETERLKAAGATVRNPNTSKRKVQAVDKAKEDERQAAERAAEKAARRKALGMPESDTPESQVGNRRYARGRAYVADRYTNPEAAAEKTAEAAALSEQEPEIEALPAVEDTAAEAAETAAEVIAADAGIADEAEDAAEADTDEAFDEAEEEHDQTADEQE